MDENSDTRTTLLDGAIPSDGDIEHLDKERKFKRYMSIAGFFMAGLINNFAYVVFLAAAGKLLGSAATALLANIIPTLLFKLVAPFFIHAVPYRVRIYLVAALGCAAFICVAFNIDNEGMVIMGMILGSIGSGMGEVTCLSYSVFFHKNTVSGWSSGTGAAGVLGTLIFIAMSNWAGLDNKTIMEIFLVIPLLLIVVFEFMMLKDPRDATVVQRRSQVETDGLINHKPKEGIEDLTFFDKLKFVRPLLRYMIPLFLVYYLEYSINQGLDLPLATRFGNVDDYETFQLMYQIGVLISRSSVNFIQIRKLWIFPLFQAINWAILFSHIESPWLGSIYVAYVIIFWEGLLGGGTYVNAFACISEEVAKEYVEFSMSIASVADSMGITLSGVTSLFIERALCQMLLGRDKCKEDDDSSDGLISRVTWGYY